MSYTATPAFFIIIKMTQPEGVTSLRWKLTTKNDKLIAIAQISTYFGLLILSLRHFWIFPANHYGTLVAMMLIGFLPSLAYRWCPPRYASYIMVGNGLFIVSMIFVLLQEWALSGVFLLIPVFSLLFRDRAIYLISSVAALILNIVLALAFVFDKSQSALQTVILLDVLTVFVIMVFIIYFVVKDLRWRYMAEAKHLQTILALSQSVEAKDAYTQGHSERVAHVGRMLARDIPDIDPETVYNCGLIHDVGKLSIPDSILLKKTRLTEEEFRIMKAHTTTGAKLCTNLNIQDEIVLGVLHHHEKWDGTGYPNALKGESIPLIGRVLCVADSIDAMCTNRAYRNALEMERVFDELKRCEGTQFDPVVVRVALVRWDEIRAYYASIRFAPQLAAVPDAAGE